MNYDEAIVAFHDMHPEYDTANGGTHLLHDKVLDALKRAKKIEELLDLYRLQKRKQENHCKTIRPTEIYLKEEELEELK